MPRYLYGSSAEAIASQEMGRDSARDQRFFQSLAAQRAAQAQLDDEIYRQSQFQAQERERAEQAARYAAQNRLAYNRQQQNLELGMERVAAQRDLGMEKNRFLEDKLNQERLLAEQRLGLQRDLGQGRMELQRDLGGRRLDLGYDQLDVRRNLGERRFEHLAQKLELDKEIAKERFATQREIAQKKIDYWSSRPTSAEARMEIEEAKREAEAAEVADAVTRYQELDKKRQDLLGTRAFLDEAPNAQRRFVSENSKWYIPFDNAPKRRAFADNVETERLRSFYPPGLPEGYTKKMDLSERIKLADPQIERQLEDVEYQMGLLEDEGVTQYLNRRPAAPTATATNLPPAPLLSRPQAAAAPPLGGGGSGGVAPARVIADAQAAIASGKDPRWIIQAAKEKYGVDLTQFLK